jgi:hypothetical protein
MKKVLQCEIFHLWYHVSAQEVSEFEVFQISNYGVRDAQPCVCACVHACVCETCLVFSLYIQTYMDYMFSGGILGAKSGVSW